MTNERVRNPYFRIVAEDDAGGRYAADPSTAGPWSDELQHGGPPGALLVRAAQRLAPPGFTAMRLAAEFLGPVPVAEVEVSARVVRAARSALLAEVRLSAAGRECLHGRVWLIAERDTTAVAHPLPEAAAPPHGLPGIGGEFPYRESIEWQSLGGSLLEPGPGATWARPLVPLLEGETLSGLQRVVLIGDSAGGISSELDWQTWTFVNVDLDVHLSRPVQGEWVLLDARTTLGPAGSALATSVLSDLHGPVGGTAQTLVIVAR